LGGFKKTPLITTGWGTTPFLGGYFIEGDPPLTGKKGLVRLLKKVGDL